jgi:hypothetical protein
MWYYILSVFAMPNINEMTVADFLFKQAVQKESSTDFWLSLIYYKVRNEPKSKKFCQIW